MTQTVHAHAGYHFLAGHPVPYSFTVQRDGRTLERLSRQARAAAQYYLEAMLPGARITRTAGGYVFYALALEEPK